MGTCQFSTCVDAKDVETEKINMVHGNMECTDINGIKYNIILTRDKSKKFLDKSEKINKSPPQPRGRPRSRSKSPQ